MLTSGPDNPTTLNFLPETHIVVGQRAATSPATTKRPWDMLRERYGKGVLPRTVNMITGPSRSADIEQTMPPRRARPAAAAYRHRRLGRPPHPSFRFSQRLQPAHQKRQADGHDEVEEGDDVVGLEEQEVEAE